MNPKIIFVYRNVYKFTIYMIIPVIFKASNYL